MDNAHLVRLLALRSYREGRFILSSGVESSFYIDARRTTMSPEGLRLIGTLGLQALRVAGWSAVAIGGLTLGADPVSFAISYASTEQPPLLRAFTVRKEPKSHGTGQVIEGAFQSGDQCVIAEDVITTGASARKALDAVRAAGGEVVGILGVVDREEGGRQSLESEGIPVLTLATLSEIRAAYQVLPTNRIEAEK